MPLHRSTLLATLLVASATSLAAQGRIGCASGAPVVTLGTLDLDCVQCTVHTDADRWIEYGAEPTVKRAESGSEGLRAGDVIVSIDGALITTAAGARRLANPDPDRPSSVMVRRDGKQLTLNVSPQLRCPVNVVVRGGPADRVYVAGWFARDNNTGRLAWGRAGRAMADSAHIGIGVGSGRGSSSSSGVGFGRGGGVQGDSEPRSGIATARSGIARSGTARSGTARGVSVGDTSMAMDSGWLGFGIECSYCTVRTEIDGRGLWDFIDGRGLWDFSEAPTVLGVESGSPAALAGIKKGDRIHAIDGLALTSAAGAERFSTIRPGQKVAITIERGGKSRVIQMTAGKRHVET